MCVRGTEAGRGRSNPFSIKSAYKWNCLVISAYNEDFLVYEHRSGEDGIRESAII